MWLLLAILLLLTAQADPMPEACMSYADVQLPRGPLILTPKPYELLTAAAVNVSGPLNLVNL